MGVNKVSSHPLIASRLSRASPQAGRPPRAKWVADEQEEVEVAWGISDGASRV